MREKAISGMMASAGSRDTGRGVKALEETIKLKSDNDIAVQTTTEEGLVPLPVSSATIDNQTACSHVNSHFTLTAPQGWLGGMYNTQWSCVLC